MHYKRKNLPANVRAIKIDVAGSKKRYIYLSRRNPILVSHHLMHAEYRAVAEPKLNQGSNSGLSRPWST